MTTPAGNIQDAIDLCANNIAELAYDGVVSIQTRMTAWLAAIFGDAGVFPASLANSDTQRRVLDWRGPSNMADQLIEGPAPGDAGVIGVSAVIDAVVRTLYAVRDSALAGAITTVQRNSTVTAFNAQWT